MRTAAAASQRLSRLEGSGAAPARVALGSLRRREVRRCQPTHTGVLVNDPVAMNDQWLGHENSFPVVARDAGVPCGDGG